MKKIFIGLGILGALLFMLLLIGRFTGMLLFYKIPTPSNEPNLKIGDRVYTTNLKDPSPYNFIVFTSKYIDSISSDYAKPGSIYLQRLCGIAGDIIEMKDGTLYINNGNFDKGIDLCNQYIITAGDYSLIEEEDIGYNEQMGGFISGRDSAVVYFDNTLLAKYQSRIKLTRYIIKDHFNDCFKWYYKNTTWTPDNFGPLKVPSDCYFVLGDNRHNALDSRYTGFVKKENIKGVILNK